MARSANTFLLCLWFDVRECLDKSEAAACDYMLGLRLPLLSDQIQMMCGGTAPKMAINVAIKGCVKGDGSIIIIRRLLRRIIQLATADNDTAKGYATLVFAVH